MSATQTFKVSGHCRITARATREHLVDCDHCDGTGKTYANSVAELCRRWREQINVSQKQVALIAKSSVPEVSRFERGVSETGHKYAQRIIRALEVLSEKEI